MKRIFLTLLTCIGALLSVFYTPMILATPDFIIPKINENMNTLYKIHQKDFLFESKPYRLFIAEPKANNKPLSVLYMLDGNAQFPIAVNTVDPTQALPLIVGIGYVSENAYAIAERQRDYTFPVNGEDFKNGGGASDFLRFIQTQVKPEIEQQYHINPEKQFFFGHSFTSLIYFNITH